ncbi:Mu-like prophage I protein [compost metagenome]
MNREQLIALLGLASDASDEDIQTALTTLKGDSEKVPQLEQALAAAKAKTPDPAKYVPLAVVEELKKDVAALRSTQIGSEVNGLVEGGLADGRLLPAQEEWARELGKKDIAALKTYLDKTPAIAALKGQQTTGKPPVPATVEELDAEALAVCKAMGTDPKDYLAALTA